MIDRNETLRIQTLLVEAGYDIGRAGVDGIWGKRTAAAWAAWQTAQGIRTDFSEFRGEARRIDDIDLPRIGAQIDVGEDELHALIEVESSGSGFDDQGRPKMLFEPHRFWRELGPGPQRDQAAQQGLAYRKWGTRPYPRDSYPRLLAAMAIHETAALRSCSWGMSQIMGSNHGLIGYRTVQDMVLAFMRDEEFHLQAMVDFCIANGIDDDLREHNWAQVARVYNGSKYHEHHYDLRLERAYAKWAQIRDTPFEG